MYSSAVSNDLGEIGVADGFAARYNAAAAEFYHYVRANYCATAFKEMCTFASHSKRLVPSAPDQNRDSMTIECAMISWGRRSRIPVAWSSLVVSYRIESSRSLGTPSSCDADVSKSAGLASGLTRCEGPITDGIVDARVSKTFARRVSRDVLK